MSPTSHRDRVLTEAVQSERKRLRAAIASRVRDQAEAEDILQETFSELMRAHDLGQAIETLGAWLWRVAQNKILDRFRRGKTRQAYLDSPEAALASEATSRDEPEDDFTRSWLRAEISAAIEELPPEQRDAFVRHELEGQSFEEISAATGVKVNTLLARKRYAIRFLRNYLKEVYDELE